jgi:hypothetical protein
MRTRKICLALATLAVALSVAGSAAAQCNPDHVSVAGRSITVSPTGLDDTANLRCALELGAGTGPGVEVKLEAGTYYTEQLVIADFRGTFEGAGREATVLRTPEYPLPVYNPCDAGAGVVECFLDSPPSAVNPYPSLVTVITSDVTISDMSIRVVGEYGTEPYYLSPTWTLKFIMGVVTALGPDVSLDITRVEVDAGPPLQTNVETHTYSGGANTGITTAAGAGQGPDLTFTNGTLRVTDSIVVKRGSGTTVLGNLIQHGRLFFHRNLLIGTMAFSNVLDMEVRLEGNEIETFPSQAGVSFTFAGGGATADSSLWFANNVFSGRTAIQAAPGVFVNVDCLAVNNDVSRVATPYTWNDNVCKVVADK